MLKPEERRRRWGWTSSRRPCSKLAVIGDHLETGIYGARTPDRTEYTHIFEWPLACAPIAAAILDAKFAATFGARAEADAEAEEDADE